MKVPEKIYLIPDNRMVDNLSIIWYEAPYSTGAIEYTRTDTFIDKACSFLKSYRQETPDGMGYIAGIVNDKTIEDFRKAQKGENCEIGDSINIRLDYEQADLIVNALHEFRTTSYERSRMDNSENTPRVCRALDTIDRLEYHLKLEIANKLKNQKKIT